MNDLTLCITLAPLAIQHGQRLMDNGINGESKQQQQYAILMDIPIADTRLCG
jgi:hypothetical protein